MKNALKKYGKYCIVSSAVSFIVFGMITYIHTVRDAIDVVLGRIDADDYLRGVVNRWALPIREWR